MSHHRGGQSKGWSRRSALKVTAGAAAAGIAGITAPHVARAQAPLVRYAASAGTGPNELQTVVFSSQWLRDNVLKRFGKDYTVEITHTRGTPEVATLFAAGRADVGTLSYPIFATTVLKGVVPGGLKIIADIYQSSRPGYGTNYYFVHKDSPLKSVKDLKGKVVAVNAFGSSVDLVLRVILTKAGLDPRRDVNIVEVGFASTGAAIRERRIDCGILLLPFTPLETAKGDLRPLVSEAEAFGPFAVIFQAARTRFLSEQPDVARAYLDDYVRAMRWFYDPANRVAAVNLLADLMKTPRETVGAYFLTPDDYYRDPNGCVGVPHIQRPIDAMVEHGLLAQRVDMAQYVDLSYLPNPCST